MSRTPIRRCSLLLALLVLVVSALGTACGGAGGTTADPSEVGPGATLVARPSTDTPVFAEPGDDTPAQVLPTSNEFGSPLALVVVEQRDGWLHVQLPTRPNGSSGWIAADGVDLRTLTTSVRVDLAARNLVVTDGGRTVLESAIAIGASDTPTPTGTFYVVDKLATGEPTGPYGSFAAGLSGHSEQLTDFAGGDGQIGIHGTNDPGSIGAAVSHGCVRVPDDVAVQLQDLLALGTPVTIG